MAAAGGHWTKIAQGNIGKLVFVPKGQTDAQAISGAKAPASPGGFPASLDSVTVVKGLGGSTGAKLVQDDAGNLYVMKRGGNSDHLLEESYADEAYRAMGLGVPEMKVYQTPGGPAKLARFVEGETLSHAGASAKTVNAIKAGFVADALLGNWDVIGLGRDNILVDKAGKVYRIDNGGSLSFRAQGAKKAGHLWTEFPMEIFSMRNSSINHQAASIFGSLSLGAIAKQVSAFSGKFAAAVGKMPAGLRSIVSGRVARLGQFANIYKTLSTAGHSEAAIGAYVQRLWSGLQSGKVTFDPKTAAEINKSFLELGG